MATRIPPKTMAKKLVRALRTQHPDYHYLKKVFQHTRDLLVLAAGITQRVPLAVMSRTWRAFWFSCMSTEWVSDAD